MCFHSKQSKTAQELSKRFNAKIEAGTSINAAIYNGFEFPKTPIISNENPEKIQLFHWGLIPEWAKDESIRKNTLNAKLETLSEKPSFKNSLNKRCLVIADGFYEWKWLDAKGRQKQKYLLSLPNDEPFAFAGLWSEWKNQLTEEKISTYTLITTEANALMSEIHNTKKRMPIIVAKEHETDWLKGKQDIRWQNNQLIATEIGENLQTTLNFI